MVPDEVEPTIAWRSWFLDGLDQLAPISMSMRNPRTGLPIWPHRQSPHALCLDHSFSSSFSSIFSYQVRPKGYALSPPHHAPSEQCMCGYWALKAPPEHPNQVVGTVKLWGRIVCGSEGYRAEYAYPERLYLLDQKVWELEPRWHREGRARLLGEAYGVECTLISGEEYELLRAMETPEAVEPAEEPVGVELVTEKDLFVPAWRHTSWQLLLLWILIAANLFFATLNLGEVLWRG